MVESNSEIFTILKSRKQLKETLKMLKCGPLYITINEAKAFWIAAIANDTADQIDYVEVHPCVCKWKAAHNQPHPCALNRMGDV